ncbi:arginine--tRNA ligase [Patescibacteria group bacterium]
MFRSAIHKEIEKNVPANTVFEVRANDDEQHGDYSSNVALILSKAQKKNPQEVAKELTSKLKLSFIEKVEIADPGFLNFYIKKEELVKNLFKKNSLAKKKTKVNIEFISANPTGPLTMANGRGGFYGDVLANVLTSAGYDVTREYYINDSGNQVDLLGESIKAAEGKIPDKEEYYKGDYIKDLKGKSAEEAVDILLGQIKKSLKNAGINFDVWFSENKNLRKTKSIDRTLKFLEGKNAITEKDGAVWFDDIVLVKSNGEPTYFLADFAYHYDKLVKRKFDIVINIWGADHHGHVSRIQKGIQAMDINPDQLKFIIMQLVRLISKGKEVRMGKRSGEFITLDELLEMVGQDAARWFFLERTPNTHMDFDLDLAKEQSKKNPVYYVQYAHARACSILRRADSKIQKTRYNLLSTPQELLLIKKLLQLPEVLEDIAKDYQVQRLPHYAYELAKTFTDFYENCQVVYPESDRRNEGNKGLTEARLTLVNAAKKVLAETLGLMGITTPEKM